MATYPVTPATLPTGSCPTTYQDMLNLFSAYQSVTIPSSSGNVVVSATTPTDTTAVWIRLDGFGRPVGTYYFASGAWLSPHPLVPGATMMWTTALPSMNTFDGGDANAVSAISGPMWEVVTAFAARSPIGVGTLPSGAVINVGDQLGSETQTSQQHTHVTGRFDGGTSNKSDDWYGLTGTDTLAGAAQGTHGDNGLETQNLNALPGAYTVTGPMQTVPPAFSIVHPVLGVYLLRRTARLFYAV